MSKRKKKSKKRKGKTQFYCGICNRYLATQQGLESHNGSVGHEKKYREKMKGKTEFCHICNKNVPVLKMNTHVHTRPHTDLLNRYTSTFQILGLPRKNLDLMDLKICFSQIGRVIAIDYQNGSTKAVIEFNIHDPPENFMFQGKEVTIKPNEGLINSDKAVKSEDIKMSSGIEDEKEGEEEEESINIIELLQQKEGEVKKEDLIVEVVEAKHCGNCEGAKKWYEVKPGEEDKKCGKCGGEGYKTEEWWAYTCETCDGYRHPKTSIELKTCEECKGLSITRKTEPSNLSTIKNQLNPPLLITFKKGVIYYRDGEKPTTDRPIFQSEQKPTEFMIPSKGLEKCYAQNGPPKLIHITRFLDLNNKRNFLGWDGGTAYLYDLQYAHVPLMWERLNPPGISNIHLVGKNRVVAIGGGYTQPSNNTTICLSVWSISNDDGFKKIGTTRSLDFGPGNSHMVNSSVISRYNDHWVGIWPGFAKNNCYFKDLPDVLPVRVYDIERSEEEECVSEFSFSKEAVVDISSKHGLILSGVRDHFQIFDVKSSTVPVYDGKISNMEKYRESFFPKEYCSYKLKFLNNYFFVALCPFNARIFDLRMMGSAGLRSVKIIDHGYGGTDGLDIREYGNNHWGVAGSTCTDGYYETNEWKFWNVENGSWERNIVIDGYFFLMK